MMTTMNNYVVIVPENVVAILHNLIPGLQFLPIAAVTHADDPEQKRYLINMETPREKSE